MKQKQGCLSFNKKRWAQLFGKGIALSLIFGCSASRLKYEDHGGPPKTEEFDKSVQIQELKSPSPVPSQFPNVDSRPKESNIPGPMVPMKKKAQKKRKAEEPLKGEIKISLPVDVGPRLPEMESREGFAPGSRRPLKDPFRVGEKVVLSVKFFAAQAGELTLEVTPLMAVNGKTSYRFVTRLKTAGIFSRFYSVDDWSETLVDYETLIPNVFTLHVQESAQLKEARAVFDSEKLLATYWENKYTEKNGHENKKQQWKMLPYSQNVFSAAYYLRNFDYEVGKGNSFTVTDDEKNITFTARAIRKEKIEVEAGEFNTIVIKPDFQIDGVFKPMGDIFLWLTDDDRKLIVKIESNIKIGTLSAEAISVHR